MLISFLISIIVLYGILSVLYNGIEDVIADLVKLTICYA